MAFPSAALSACDVEEVAATAAGVMCRRAAAEGGRGGAAAGMFAVCCRAACLSESRGVALVMAEVVAGAAFRAIGRGLGNGTLAGAAVARPATSTRQVARAVDRNAAARMVRVTAFLRGESFKLTGLEPIWLNMWTKY